MIGMIRFDRRGGIAEAVLGDDGCWGCAAVPCLVRPLDILYSPNRDEFPAGRRHLEEAAHWLKGVIVFGNDSPSGRHGRRIDRRGAGRSCPTGDPAIGCSTPRDGPSG